METLIRSKREMKEAEELGIAATYRTGLRLRTTAFIICVVYGIFWIMVHK